MTRGGMLMRNFNGIMGKGSQGSLIERQDQLTQVYNKSTAEELIRKVLMNGGAMFICGVVGMSQINSKQGHLRGDKCLHEVATILKYIAGDNAIIGRMYGDVFIIYKTEITTEEEKERFKAQILNRFKSYNKTSVIRLTVNVGCTVHKTDDTFNNMVYRCEQNLEEERSKSKSKTKKCNKSIKPGGYWEVDMKLVCKDLTEHNDNVGGAFCQDYETFKNIYRYIERALVRSKEPAVLLLISLSNGCGEFLSFENYARVMDDLGDLIQDALRVGDIYAKYSNCQYVALLDGADEKVGKLMEERLKGMFDKSETLNRQDIELNCLCRTIEPYKA